MNYPVEITLASQDRRVSGIQKLNHKKFHKTQVAGLKTDPQGLY